MQIRTVNTIVYCGDLLHHDQLPNRRESHRTSVLCPCHLVSESFESGGHLHPKRHDNLPSLYKHI
jgi:hypothetical protein